jgi:hypothetical protein
MSVSLTGLVDVKGFTQWAGADVSRWEKLVGAGVIHRMRGAAQILKVTSRRGGVTLKVHFRREGTSQGYTDEAFARSFVKISFGRARRK